MCVVSVQTGSVAWDRHRGLGEQYGTGDTGANCQFTFSEVPHSKKENPGSTEMELGQASFYPVISRLAKLKQ